MTSPTNKPARRSARAEDAANEHERTVRAKTAKPAMLGAYDFKDAICHRFHISIDGRPYVGYRQEVLVAVVEMLASPRLELPDVLQGGGARPANLLTLAQDYDHRYEHLRAIVCDWTNRANEADALGFSRCTFDVWIGQRSTAGAYEATMDVVLVAPPGGALPSPALQALLRSSTLPRTDDYTGLPWFSRKRPGPHAPLYLATERGVNPLALGAFLDVRIASGTIPHTWKLNQAFHEACSAQYRALHGLAGTTRDPYRQIISGAQEPSNFTWNLEA